MSSQMRRKVHQNEEKVPFAKIETPHNLIFAKGSCENKSLPKWIPKICTYKVHAIWLKHLLDERTASFAPLGDIFRDVSPEGPYIALFNVKCMCWIVNVSVVTPWVELRMLSWFPPLKYMGGRDFSRPPFSCGHWFECLKSGGIKSSWGHRWLSWASI